MQRIGGKIIYSATDLNNDLECEHLTWLEYQAALGKLARPQPGQTAQLLSEKGQQHEARCLDGLRKREGAGLIAFDERVENTIAALREAEAKTLDAMASGARIVYQPTLFDGTFLGRADFLRRVETPSARWPYSYEVLDAKLNGALGSPEGRAHRVPSSLPRG